MVYLTRESMTGECVGVLGHTTEINIALVVLVTCHIAARISCSLTIFNLTIVRYSNSVKSWKPDYRHMTLLNDGTLIIIELTYCTLHHCTVHANSTRDVLSIHDTIHVDNCWIVSREYIIVHPMAVSVNCKVQMTVYWGDEHIPVYWLYGPFDSARKRALYEQPLPSEDLEYRQTICWRTWPAKKSDAPFRGEDILLFADLKPEKCELTCIAALTEGGMPNDWVDRYYMEEQPPRVIYITSACDPRTFFTKCKKDKWYDDPNYLLRRITHVYYCTKDHCERDTNFQ